MSFRKRINKQAQQIENTKVFCNTLYCFAICLSIVITSVHTVMQIIVRKMISTPHRLPPLSLLAQCWRRRHHCNGCHVAAAIAAIVIAAATCHCHSSAANSAATISAAIATTFWLIVVCPCAASLLPPPLPNPAVAAGGCQRHCHSAAANGCLLLLLPQPLPQFQPLFSLVMFKILHKLSNILNIFTATFWLIVVYPHLSLLLPPLPAPTVARLPISSS